MLKKIVYPGSFDPITFGHIDIIERLTQRFDQVIVLISSSTQKKYVFNLNERKSLVQKIFENEKKIVVDSWDGLLVEYLRKNEVRSIAKGLRNSRDFDYEITMDHTNKVLYPDIETFYLISKSEYSFISSTLVKEIASLGGDLSKFVPDVILQELKKQKLGES